VILEPHETCDESVAACRLTQETALGEALLEERSRVGGRVELRAQLCAHELEVGAVGHLLVRQALETVLDVGDALVVHRVRAQVRRCAALVHARRPLQALEENGHGARIVSGGLENLEPDTVGLTLVISREIEHVLHRARLSQGDCGARYVGIRTRRKNGDRERCQ
jgi:hypothetical protein